MKKYLFLILLSFVFISCAKTPAGYFPMKIGDKWEYNFKSTSAQGTSNLIMEYSITEKIKEGENEYYKFETSLQGSPNPQNKQVDYYRESPLGIVIKNADPSKKDELVVLPSDLKIGTEWDAVYSTSKRHFKVAAFEPLAIGDNNYKDCVKVEYEDVGSYEQNSGYYYFAKGVGLVKIYNKNEKVDKSVSSTEATLAKFSE